MDIQIWIRKFLTYFWKEDGHDSPRVKAFVAILLAIWIHRNEVTFRKIDTNPVGIIHLARKFIDEALEATQLMRITRGDRKICGVECEGKHNLIVFKNNFVASPCDLIIAGCWKRIKKKNFAIDACQAEMKALSCPCCHSAC